jgi:hypothetical protein
MGSLLRHMKLSRQVKTGIILVVALFVNASFPEDATTGSSKLRLPMIDLEANVGLYWILQGKTTWNVNDKLYGKIRISATLFASEGGFTVGYQYTPNTKNRVQFGLGYSNGNVDPDPFGSPGGSSYNPPREYWNGVIGELDCIHYFSESVIRMGLNFGMSLILSKRNPMGSFNAGLVVGML